MLNLNESYIKVTKDLYITEAITNDINCKLICLNNNINIYGYINLLEKKYTIQPIRGDRISCSGWYDMEQAEIDIYCILIEEIINNNK